MWSSPLKEENRVQSTQGRGKTVDDTHNEIILSPIIEIKCRPEALKVKRTEQEDMLKQ